MQRSVVYLARRSSFVAAKSALRSPKPAAAALAMDYLPCDDVKAVLQLQQQFKDQYGRSSVFRDAEQPRGVWSA
jgi:hypothetical protein